MPSPHRKWLMVALLAAFGTQPVEADEIVTGGVTGTRFEHGGYAYGGTLSWQQPIAQGGVLANLSSTDYPIGRLTSLDLDGYGHLTSALTISGGMSLGDATGDGRSDELFKARIALDARLDSQWSIHLADQYTDLAEIHGQLVVVSTQYMPTLAYGISLGGGYGLTGTVADRYAAISINSYGRLQAYGGVVYGRTGYDPATLGQVAIIRHLVQVYAGFSVPLKHGRLTLGADSLDLEGDNRQTLRIGYIQTFKP